MALAYNLPSALHTDSFTVGDYTYTGSSIYIDDGNGKWRIKFLSNGTFAPTKNVKVDIFAVGGGGSGAGDGSSVSGTRGSNCSANRGGGGWNSAGGNGGSGVIIIRKAKNFTLTAPTDFQINGKTADQTKVIPLTFTWTQGIISRDDVGPIYHKIETTQDLRHINPPLQMLLQLRPNTQPQITAPSQTVAAPPVQLAVRLLLPLWAQL